MATRRRTRGTVYEIVVRGVVSEKIGGDIGATQVIQRGPRTLVVVEVIDQPHLHGVLDRLGDLNIEIESVNPA